MKDHDFGYYCLVNGESSYSFENNVLKNISRKHSKMRSYTFLFTLGVL